MSNRTLIELNHDFCPRHLLNWAEAMRTYMRSGDPATLPDGVTFKGMRHHSDPEFTVVQVESRARLRQALTDCHLACADAVRAMDAEGN